MVIAAVVRTIGVRGVVTTAAAPATTTMPDGTTIESREAEKESTEIVLPMQTGNHRKTTRGRAAAEVSKITRIVINPRTTGAVIGDIMTYLQKASTREEAMTGIKTTTVGGRKLSNHSSTAAVERTSS